MASIIEDLSIDIWEDPEEYSPSYNIAPTHSSPILRQDKGRKVRQMRWGLIPSWARDDSFAARTINARSETLLEKPAYRNLVHKNRCIVIADGYYEWSGSSGRKVPNYIYAEDSSLLLMAGLWDRWERGNDTLFSYTIITTEASGKLERIHPRMPVILTGETANDWINVDSVSFTSLAPSLKVRSVALAHHPVSRNVNSVGYNAPDCIVPHVYPSQTQLF